MLKGLPLPPCDRRVSFPGRSRGLGFMVNSPPAQVTGKRNTMIETQLNPNNIRAERTELDAVLASDMFRRAPTLARILEYLCESQLRGETFIKEYEIATQVMGRNSDFDPQQDGSVRVNLHHLRKKLKQFYETEGANHTLWISLPIGQSLPSFVAHTAETSLPSEDAGAVEQEPRALQTKAQTSPAIPATEELSPPRRPAAADATAVIDAAPHKSRFSAALLLALVVMALLGSAVTWFWITRRTPSTSRPIMTDAAIRIGCGRSSAYQDTAGRTWNADEYFSGGGAFQRKLAQVGGATDPTIYQTGRQGDFSYDIPLPRAPYELHLYFAESFVHGEGFRAMNLSINGKRVEQMLDVTSDAGGFGIATGKVYTSVWPAPDGKVHLRFTGTTLAAFVNAIEILPGNGDRMRPIRQTTLPTYYFDPQGTVWSPDAWFHGGRTSQLTDIFPGLALEGFYQHERFGNFSYSIPVLPNRTYSLTLYFQDVWFSHQPQGKMTTGMRRFDVTCNGKDLLKQLDILQEANGAGFQVTKHFTGIAPTSQGKLLLNFTPSQNYAMINAIVVEQEPVAPLPN